MPPNSRAAAVAKRDVWADRGPFPHLRAAVSVGRELVELFKELEIGARLWVLDLEFVADALNGHIFALLEPVQDGVRATGGGESIAWGHKGQLHRRMGEGRGQGRIKPGMMQRRGAGAAVMSAQTC